MINCPNSTCGKIFRIAVPEGEPTQQGTPARRVESELEGDTLSTDLPIPDETQLLKIHPALVRRRPLKALTAAAAGLAGLVALAWWAGGPPDALVTEMEIHANGIPAPDRIAEVVRRYE